MKLSKYNILIEDKDKCYIFNTRSLAIVEIDANIKTAISQNDLSIEKEYIDAFYENGLIVDNDENEFLSVKNDYWNCVCSEQALFISIMPTLNCNLRCPYCFEHHDNNNITPEVEESILAYVKDKITNTNLEILKVDWYGGEPTLKMDVIARMANKFIEICAENGLTYISSITTNATLLSEKNARILKEAAVTHMQITIDGPKEVHDVRRVGINGEGTFDKIVGFIRDYKEIFEIVIRINVDKSNEHEVDELLEYLADNGFKDVPITIKGIVSSEERDVTDTQLEGKMLSDVIYQKNRHAIELGLKPAVLQYFDLKSDNFCIVDCLNQYIISPDGRLFKCGESYLDSDPGYVGKIDVEKKEFELNEALTNKWIKDPFVDDKCQECEILPMCYGGCQMKRNVKKSCPCNMDLKYHLKDYILLYLQSLEE